MKNLFFVFTVLLFGVFACDKVDMPVEDPGPTVTDTSGVDTTDTNGVVPFPTFDTTMLHTSSRKVLVEEFTGHSCTGCPAQTERLLELQNNNAPEVIVVAYHEGTFAEVSEDYPTDFRTEYGGNYHDPQSNEIAGYPSAIINRKTFSEFANKKHFLAHNEWAPPINASIGEAVIVALGVAADLYEDDNLIKVRVGIQALEDLTSSYRLLVLLTEDSVISQQKDSRATQLPKKIIQDYAHRHVLRDQINEVASVYGDLIIDLGSGLVSNEWIDWTTDYTIASNVVTPTKCYVVAILIDTQTSEVVQVEEVHVHEVDQ